MTRRIQAVLGLATIALVVGAVAGVASGLGAGSRRPLRLPRPKPGVALMLRREFGVFRRVSHRAHPSAALAISGVPAFFVERFGVEVSDEQWVQVNSELDVVLYPGAAGACMAWPSPQPRAGVVGDGICNGFLANIAAGGMSGVVTNTPGGNGATVVGLVPDSVKTVAVTEDNGDVVVGNVVDNVYAVFVGTNGDKSVALRDAQGRTTNSVPGVDQAAVTGIRGSGGP